MIRNFFELGDADLATGSANFYSLVNASGAAETYGLLAADVTAYGAANAAYQTAFAAANSPATRTTAAVAGKDASRDTLRRSARNLAMKVNGTPSVSDQMKIALGLKPRATPAPIRPLTVKPVGEIVGVDGNQVTFVARQADNSKRGKPESAYGMVVYSYVGENVPNDIAAWTPEGNTTRTKVIVAFPKTLAPFTKVWITCCWISPRLQAGPGPTPVATNLGTFAVQSVDANGTMKIAA